MKINIRGDDITPDKIASALATCEKQYALKIKGATIYVRFENDMGQTVEPLKDGEEFSRTFSFWKPQKKSVSPVQTDGKNFETDASAVTSISVKEMIEICKAKSHRILSNVEMTLLIELAKMINVDRRIFTSCVDQTLANNGYFSVAHLSSLVRHRHKQL